MAPALPYIAVGTSVLATTQASAIGKFNQAVQNRNAQVAEQEADQQENLVIIIFKNLINSLKNYNQKQK